MVKPNTTVSKRAKNFGPCLLLKSLTVQIVVRPARCSTRGAANSMMCVNNNIPHRLRDKKLIVEAEYKSRP